MKMDNKMMIIMMFGCMAMALLFSAIPSGWLTSGIIIALLVVLLFACCIPMIKMMLITDNQDDEI